MDEIRAALGRIQLAKLDRNNRRRREITSAMRKYLEVIEAISLPFQAYNLEESSCHIFPILLPSSNLRTSFMEYMKECDIQTSIHYPPVHRFSAYERAAVAGMDCTEAVSSSEVTLPLFANMSSQQVRTVVHAIKDFFLNSSEPIGT